MRSEVIAAIVDDPSLTGIGKLQLALEQTGLWRTIQELLQRNGNPRIVIKPDTGAFESGSPTATDPALVEALIDLLFDRGCSNLAVASGAEPSAVWAENRDALALFELLGYQFVTPSGRSYSVADLAEGTIRGFFPEQAALAGTAIAEIWASADLRIVFCKNKTDEVQGFLLCLESLINVLPLSDKDLHYKCVRDPGEVVSELIRFTPVHLALIDATVSAHGAGGQRAPARITTNTIIASTNIVLADQIGAVKMGLDPFTSPVFASCAALGPSTYEIAGSLRVYPGWRNVPPEVIRASRYRRASAAANRLVEPWLQKLDSALFPLKNPVDNEINIRLARFFRDTDSSPTSRWTLVTVNAILGLLGHALESYRTIFDKDNLQQRIAGIRLGIAEYPHRDFDKISDELSQLQNLVQDAAGPDSNFKWRLVGGATLFTFARTLPIPFEAFVERVNIARAIQYMNDYLGGSILVICRDRSGRPLAQVERNIYLPQPNYAILFHGKPIDVTKLEKIEYSGDRHRIFWKTIHSDNQSAIFDDGIACFGRSASGTEVSFFGRQLFRLPPILQVLDEYLPPELKALLVEQAYVVFFNRTIANLESVMEGRDIRVGRSASDTQAVGFEMISPLIAKAAELLGPLLQVLSRPNRAVRNDTPSFSDVDGFDHFRPTAGQPDEDGSGSPFVSEFLRGLFAALERDNRRRFDK